MSTPAKTTEAARVQGQAAELAMFLCLPAALALAVSALPAGVGDLSRPGISTRAMRISRALTLVDHRRSACPPMCW